MSTPLSLSLPATGSLATVTMTAPATSTATPSVTSSVTTAQVTYWTVLGVVSAAMAAGIFEVALHFAG